MAKSLLESLPEVVRRGKQQAEQILEGIEGRNRVTLQTRELVIPSKATAQASLMRGRTVDTFDPVTANRLIYGDNLLAMAALLAGDDETPSMRGKIDLIYIDPPFDSRADYRTSVILPGTTVEQRPSVIEQFAYSDTWSSGTASYLATIIPQLVLMRELLSPNGTLYVHLDWHVGHYAKVVLDELYGRSNFVNEVVWCYEDVGGKATDYFKRKHDVLMVYGRGGERHFNVIRKPLSASTIKRYEPYFDTDGTITYRRLKETNPGVFQS
jgi:adenine-specific DNA-methyltransferase